MPSANVLSSPGMCFAMWHHPPVISMRPRSLIRSPVRLSFAPPHLFTQDTARFHMDAAAELGRNPVSKHQIQPEYGDEQADAGRDG